MSLDQIGALIRQTRKSKKLSQQFICEQLGMSRATLSGIENNTISEIGIRKVILICTFLGIELVAQDKRSRPTLQQLQAEQKLQWSK